MADNNYLRDLLAKYNEGKGGPTGQTLLSILSQQQDPRARHWMQMEMQRRRDANNGGVLPEDLANMDVGLAQMSGPMPSNHFTPDVPEGGAVVQGQPMAPGQYEAMMQMQTQQDLLRRGRQSPMGREQSLKNASNNIGMMWDKERINNAVMPAEVGSPGLKGRLYELFRSAIGDKQAL